MSAGEFKDFVGRGAAAQAAVDKQLEPCRCSHVYAEHRRVGRDFLACGHDGCTCPDFTAAAKGGGR